jgi:pyruvate/2-oxoglutarate/acetoin dehydrogenase E1 component
MVLFTGAYENISAAVADLDAIKQLDRDEIIGSTRP